MNTQALIKTAQALVADDKGLLAMDESTGTCNKRFAKLGIPQTVEARRAYREMLVTTPGLNDSISGAILYDETIRQQTQDGTPLLKVLTAAGIIPGIKVDIGAKVLAGFPGEQITEGLDGLRERLAEYAQMGARFAKWRVVITLSEDDMAMPSRGALCRVVPGNRARPHRRAGSTHGWRAYPGALRRGDRGSPAHGFQPPCCTARLVRGHHPEAQYGVAGLDLPAASHGGGGSGCHRALFLAHRPRGRAGDCLFVGRSVR